MFDHGTDDILVASEDGAPLDEIRIPCPPPGEASVRRRVLTTAHDGAVPFNVDVDERVSLADVGF